MTHLIAAIDESMLLKAMSEFPGVSCHVLFGQSRDERDRAECLDRLVSHLLGFGVREFVLERVDAGVTMTDRRVMTKYAQLHGSAWRHEAARDEPLLWISDLVLWAYGAGGEMRRETKPLVSDVLWLQN